MNATRMLGPTLPLRWLCPPLVHVTRRPGSGQAPLFKAATEQFCCLQVVDLPVTLSPFGVTTSSLTSAHVATLVSCCKAAAESSCWTVRHHPVSSTSRCFLWRAVYSSNKGLIMLLHSQSATSTYFLYGWGSPMLLLWTVVWSTIFHSNSRVRQF